MQLVPEKQKELKEISAKYGATSLGPVTVAQVRFLTSHKKMLMLRLRPSYQVQAIGGARDVKCMLWETSLLDAQEVRSYVRLRLPHGTTCCSLVAGHPIPRLHDP